MKNMFFGVLLSILSITFTTDTVFADTIIQGNAESDSSVTTNIQGSGSVHTHIESTVNGNTKTLDSDQPGTHILNNSSGSTTSTQQVNITMTPTPTATPSPKITPHTKNSHPKITNTITNMQSFFHDFVQRLLLILHV